MQLTSEPSLEHLGCTSPLTSDAAIGKRGSKSALKAEVPAEHVESAAVAPTKLRAESSTSLSCALQQEEVQGSPLLFKQEREVRVTPQSSSREHADIALTSSARIPSNSFLSGPLGARFAEASNMMELGPPPLGSSNGITSHDSVKECGDEQEMIQFPMEHSDTGCDGGALPVRPQPSAPLSVGDADNRVPERCCGTAEVVLQLCGIEKSFPIKGTDERVIALKDINLSDSAESIGFNAIRQGEFVMIRGPSGGGKTTLLNIIGTIDKPTKGTIEFLGKPISSSSKEQYLADIRLRTIGFVFQTFNLIATMTASENVELPMTLLGKLSRKERRLRSRQLLALVGLRNRVNHLPSELSGGEQQRVTIARSLANNPAVLLLDEPTGDLDTQTTIEIMDLLLRINRMIRTTCIMVTHNADVECYADRILYVSDGRFVREARNETPKRLDYSAYATYLEEKERERTQHVAREAL